MGMLNAYRICYLLAMGALVGSIPHTRAAKDHMTGSWICALLGMGALTLAITCERSKHIRG